jgi:hypothetical protein
MNQPTVKQNNGAPPASASPAPAPVDTELRAELEQLIYLADRIKEYLDSRSQLNWLDREEARMTEKERKELRSMGKAHFMQDQWTREELEERKGKLEMMSNFGELPLYLREEYLRLDEELNRLGPAPTPKPELVG